MNIIKKLNNKENKNIEESKIDPISLFFIDKKKEQKFTSYNSNQSLILAKRNLLFGIILYGFFGLLDFYLVPEIKEQFWLIRLTIIVPTISLIIFSSFVKILNKRFHQLIPIIILLTGISISFMTIIAGGIVAYSYYTGIILILMYNYSISRIQFVTASITGILIILTYSIITLSSININNTSFISNIFFLLGANILGMLGCHNSEKKSRHNFLLVTQITEEQQKNIKINNELENRVKNRTEKIYQGFKKLQEEINIRKIAEKRELAYKEDLKQITDTALDFVSLSSQEDFYDFITKKLHELTGFQPITMSIYNSKEVTTSVKSFFVTSIILSKIKKVLGFDPKQISTKLDENSINILRTGKLFKFENGLSQLLLDIPKPLIKVLTSLLKINEVYTIGIVSNGKILGDLNIIVSGNKNIGNKKKLIELYAHLVAIAMQKRNVSQKLKANEDKYKIVVENLGEGLGIVSDKEEFIYANSAAEKIFGVQQGKLASRNLREFVKPDTLKNIQEITKNRKNNNFLTSYDIEIIRPNNEIRNISLTSSILPSENSSKTELIGIFHDNTEKIKASLKLSRKIIFEETITKILSRFVENVNFDDAMNYSLQEIGITTKASRTSILLFKDNYKYMSLSYEWCNNPQDSLFDKMQNILIKSLQNWLTDLHNNKIINISDIEDNKNLSVKEQMMFKKQNITSFLAIPLNIDNKLSGIIAIENISEIGYLDRFDFEVLLVAAYAIGKAYEQDISNKSLAKSLNEKNILLEEVLHRVNNNLQIIISMLRMQLLYSKDESVKKELQNSISRIKAMAIIHSKIYQSADYENVNILHYLNSIV